ncbi:MAG TPA: PSD1 and planctomycete cytochrome C domain-containing protein [Isosphaeraceae bacterium]|jgi:hypothetical protein|nr:PSD1 and planctomycete cytochrome C domain-containing protein [Isosphaeraceae bacterium]
MLRTATIPVLVLLVAPTARGAEEDLFTTKARPILARHCLKCHGPDEGARKAKLRLDRREDATRPAASGARAVVPGDPDESELVVRIFEEDDDQRMPPVKTKDRLTDEEKATLKRWIASGAEYREHWAFVPPRQAPLPAVRNTSWPRNPIDVFVLARLEAEGLSPSPEADRATLIRRLSLDLIGLPPTVEEVDAFLDDRSPDAYERLVDRLLASPHYGERRARRWLDLARYADTNGYEKDRTRSIWPYRDWVIRALNDDLPFDRFTVAQLAGDMLPDRSADDRVATGFHRNTMLNEEGGIDPLEYRFHAMTDRVATTATTWLGLTLGCAQCHTHKFDPITQRDYYRVMAFLDNADEPEFPVPNAEVARRRRAIEAKVAALVDALPSRFPPDHSVDDPRPLDLRRADHLDRRFRAWHDAAERDARRWTILRPSSATANLPRLEVQGDGSVLAAGDQTKSDTYTLTYPTNLQRITAIRLEVLPDDRLPRRGPGRVFYEGSPGDFFLSEFRPSAGGRPIKLAGASQSFARGGAPASLAIDGDPQTGWAIDGGQGRAHAAVFRLAEPLEASSELTIAMLFERYYASGLGRFRVALTSDPEVAEAVEMPAEVEAILARPGSERSAAERDQVFRQFLMTAHELDDARKEIDRLRSGMPSYPATLVLEERPPSSPRATHLHRRGEFLRPAERVEPGLPAILASPAAVAPRDRLGLARWLASADNPMVGRVTMNRQWAAFFGLGIVRTSQDFGYQGAPPSHPELLDWLAVEFERRGWSLKRMHRLIVTSATYRQSSRADAGLIARDPENRLLARGPRVRLEAESIRDAALRSSGLLSQKVGGPSVFPPQPPGVATEGTYGGFEWRASVGEDRHRRGLYTFTKRSAPYAMFATFDAPSGEVCVARREVSNSPLQALTMLNDAVLVEASQALGRLMAEQSGPVDERMTHLVRRCLARRPEPEELSAFGRFFEAQRDRFARKELDAAAVAGPGDGDPIDRAAWTATARALLNLDEMITKE